MKRYVEYALADGHKVMVEVDEPQSEGLTRATRGGEIIEKAAESFEQALSAVKPAVSAVATLLRELGDSPDEAAVEFGIKLGVKAGVVFASADTEAQFVFKLTWKKK